MHSRDASDACTATSRCAAVCADSCRRRCSLSSRLVEGELNGGTAAATGSARRSQWTKGQPPSCVSSSQLMKQRMRTNAPPVRFARCADRSLWLAVEKWPPSEAKSARKEKERRKKKTKNEPKQISFAPRRLLRSLTALGHGCRASVSSSVPPSYSAGRA